MNVTREHFNQLSLDQKEQLVLSMGQFIEAEDEYSYRLIHYSLGDSAVELMYDNETDKLVSASWVEDKDIRNINLDIDKLEDL
jgi:hypothetical protein